MMYRSAVRISLKRSFPPHRFQNSYSKFFGTATKKKSWKWKSTLLRWGLALGGVYYYKKSDIFSNGLGVVASQGEELKDEMETLNRLTVDAIVEERRKLRSEKVHETKASDSQTNDQQEVSADADVNHDEESRTDAFDPETGEINWDCPCLGGMAHGPCGEEFKAAFSCFIHSKEEPKGADCIEKFTTMQSCFRKHPDIYGAELDGEENAVEATEEDRDTKDVEDGFKGSEEVPQSSDSIAQSPSQTDLSVNQGNLDNPDRKL